jgi:hypothetical protein
MLQFDAQRPVPLRGDRRSAIQVEHDRLDHPSTLPLHPGHLQPRLAAMTSSTDRNPEDEYADDEYADHDAEDREQPSTPEDIPDDEPEADVLEQRQEVPYPEDDG